ncbi:LOW QUALITY PROTEIN: methyltransferase, partial [Rhodococcus opacus PD630]
DPRAGTGHDRFLQPGVLGRPLSLDHRGVKRQSQPASRRAGRGRVTGQCPGRGQRRGRRRDLAGGPRVERHRSGRVDGGVGTRRRTGRRSRCRHRGPDDVGAGGHPVVGAAGPPIRPGVGTFHASAGTCPRGPAPSPGRSGPPRRAASRRRASPVRSGDVRRPAQCSRHAVHTGTGRCRTGRRRVGDPGVGGALA